jgi:hypothetical protein
MADDTREVIVGEAPEQRPAQVEPRAPVTSATVTIAAAGSLSTALNTGASGIAAIMVPAGWSPVANLSFQISADDISFFDVFDDTGNEIMITAKPGTAVIVDNTTWMQAVSWIKFRSGSRDTPVPQDIQQTLTVFLK